MSKKINETKVLLTDVRLSYANIFEPTSYGNNEPKYSTAILIDKDDKETLSVINDAIKSAKQNGINGPWGGKEPKGLKMPIRDGDEERDDEPYQNVYFFNASSTIAPQVVGKFLDPKTGKAVELGPNEVYSGSYVNITINFYPYNAQGNKGVAAGLGNIQFNRDGKRLDGHSDAEDDFSFEDGELDVSQSQDDDWLF